MSRSILMLTPAIPYPPRQGASLRNYYLLKGLSRSNSVHLLSFADQPPSADALAHLEALTSGVTLIPVPERTTRDRLRDLLTSFYPDMGHRLWSDRFREAFSRLLQSQGFDWIQIEGIELARYADLLTDSDHSPQILFDNHNAESDLQWRTFQTDLNRPRRWPAAAYSLAQVAKLRYFERAILMKSDLVTAVSPADAQRLTQLAPKVKRPILSIPNMIDVETYQSPAQPNDPSFDLVFTGKMDYRPNVDGMSWFLRDIWPKILAQRPQATLGIVGQKPHPILEQAVQEAKNTTLTGFVPEIQPYIRGASVIIMPLRMGSGTRLKLLEAMASGRPVVSTRVGAEGYPVQHGREVLFADTPNEFVAQTIALLKSPERQQTIGEMGAQFAQKFDWRVQVPTLIDALN